ncbi:hypothetical protein OEZ86_012995 [Tetradesmus obliquus]|nr:hypothetical protein OEZ86_012995 [Tetradesmus obliquus]
MSSYSSSDGSSFASSDQASSVGSENTDSRALNSFNSGQDGEGGDEIDTNSKSFQEGAFATLYTLTKNRQLDASLRVAALKVVLEFLQFFRVLFNMSFPWVIQRDLWIFKAVQAELPGHATPGPHAVCWRDVSCIRWHDIAHDCWHV